MTKKELIQKLAEVDDEADIILNVGIKNAIEPVTIASDLDELQVNKSRSGLMCFLYLPNADAIGVDYAKVTQINLRDTEDD